MSRNARLYDLSIELLEDIFCRLPMRNIVQLTSVCKFWYAIVTHPRFISMHVNCCAKNPIGYLIHHRGHQISRLDKGFEFSEKLEFPFYHPSKFLLVGSCDGLLCMRQICLGEKKELFPSIYLWNPSIRKLKKLPTDHTTHHQYHKKDVIDTRSYVSAFGFDRQTNDYKVFHIVRSKLLSNKLVINYHLYSLNTNSWKVIQANIQGNHHHPSLFPSRYHGCRTYFNGAFYWIQLRKYPTCSRYMLWFDFCSERIWRTKLPVYDNQNQITMSLGSHKNSLVLYISDARKCHQIFQSGPCTIDTWMTKKLCSGNGEVIWERQLSVLIPFQLAWPLTTGLNGEILVSQYYCLNNLQFHYRFGVYHFKEQNIREVDTHVCGDTNVDKYIRILGSFTYSESLLLLEGGEDTYYY